MLARKLIISCCLTLFVFVVAGQKSQHSVLLPSSAARSIPKQPPNQGSWKPTRSDLADMEANLSQVAVLNIQGWPSRLHIDHPESYLRQYVAVIYGGKKLIYVNAFCDAPPPPDWRNRLHLVTDGATCYWQALYDPATKKFSSLTINSRA